jgi:uncharacterized protein YjdB
MSPKQFDRIGHVSFTDTNFSSRWRGFCALSSVFLLILLAGCSTQSLRSITLTPASGALTLAVGQTVQFKALGAYVQGKHPANNVDITNSVTWSSSTVAVATVSTGGLVTAVSAGTTTITATMNGGFGLLTASSNITVTGTSTGGTYELTSITIIPNSQTVTASGETIQFTAIGNYSNGAPATQDLTSQATWISSSSQVATINTTGLATAVGAGTVTITATAQSANGSVVAGTATLTVVSGGATGLTSITLIPGSQTVSVVGETVQFVAIGNYTGVTPATKDLTSQATWTSSDVQVGTVNASGLVTATGTGTTTITASALNANEAVIVTTATVTVTSATAPGLSAITIIPTTQTVFSFGETSQYIAMGTFTGVTPAIQDVTNSVTWVSSDVKVATINSAGLATANSAGTSAITAIGTRTDGSLIIGAATFTAAGSGTVPIGPVTLPTLEVYKVGNGAATGLVTNTPAPPISCGTGNTCTGSFPVGTTVTLTATPGSGSTFGGWSSNCMVATANSCTVTMSDNQAVGAIFY